MSVLIPRLQLRLALAVAVAVAIMFSTDGCNKAAHAKCKMQKTIFNISIK